MYSQKTTASPGLQVFVTDCLQLTKHKKQNKQKKKNKDVAKTVYFVQLTDQNSN